MFQQPGFLGTGASLASDLSLLAYLVLLLPAMLLGFTFARRKLFVPHHKFVMTGIVILNWVFIILVMAVSYSGGVASQIPDNIGDPFVLLPTIHLVTGAIAQILATYLVARMWLENVLPEWSKVRNIKRYMRVTLTLWVVTALLGITIYVVWYVQPVVATGDAPVPAATEEAGQDGDALDPVTTEEAEQDDDEALDPAATEDVAATPEPAEAATDAPADPVATEEAEATPEPTDADTDSSEEPPDPVTTEEAG